MPLSHPWADPAPAPPRLLRQPVALLQLSGPDTLRFLHGQTSQDLALAPAGAWLSTCCISPTARLRALVEVLVEEQAALLVIQAGDAAAVRQALDRVLFPADAVTLGVLQEALWLEPLGGEEAAAASGTPASAERRWQALPDGGWRLGPAWLLPAGTPLPASLAALQPLEPWEQELRRLRLGLPALPGEIHEGVNPFELGLADRVSLSKGCYVGQETLAKLATYDGVKQQLRRWYAPAEAGSEGGRSDAGAAGAAAGAAPEAGSPLVTATGERAGVISSCLALPDGSGWVGLALVRRAALGDACLWCHPTATAAGWRLELSLPERFVAPPQGAGSQAAAPKRAGAA